MIRLSRKNIARIIVYILLPIIIVIPLYLNLKRSKIAANEGAAAGTLKTFNHEFATYKKKRYSGFNSYPVGYGTAPNDGKYCGLYYAQNSADERVTLIGAAEAAADCRADGDTDSINGEIGSFRPYYAMTTMQYAPPITFELSDKQGYWFGMMMQLQGDTTAPAFKYDRETARNRYAICAFPADYGSSGENTFIMNEEGTVYSMDLEKGGYIPDYPATDPVRG